MIGFWRVTESILLSPQRKYRACFGGSSSTWRWRDSPTNAAEPDRRPYSREAFRDLILEWIIADDQVRFQALSQLVLIDTIYRLSTSSNQRSFVVYFSCFVRSCAIRIFLTAHHCGNVLMKSSNNILCSWSARWKYVYSTMFVHRITLAHNINTDVGRKIFVHNGIRVSIWLTHFFLW